VAQSNADSYAILGYLKRLRDALYDCKQNDETYSKRFVIGNKKDIDNLNPNISERIISDLNAIDTEEISKKNKTEYKEPRYGEMIEDLKKVVDVLSRQGLNLNIGELLAIFKDDKVNASVRLSGAIFHLKMAGLVVDNKGAICKAFFKRQKPLTK